MARRLGHFNPERRIENEGNFSEKTSSKKIIEDGNPYEDEFDKKLDGLEGKKTESPREAFVKSFRVEQQSNETPLTLAYKELDRARQSGVREDIIMAEDKILDLQRQEEEKSYNSRIAELKEMQKSARESGDPQAMQKFKSMRNSFVQEMEYDRLNYEIGKLQNSQELEPSREKLQEIVALKQQLAELEDKMNVRD